MWAYTRGRALVFITALEFSITCDEFSAVGSCDMAERSVYCGKSQNGCLGRERERAMQGWAAHLTDVCCFMLVWEYAKHLGLLDVIGFSWFGSFKTSFLSLSLLTGGLLVMLIKKWWPPPSWPHCPPARWCSTLPPVPQVKLRSDPVYHASACRH